MHLCSLLWIADDIPLMEVERCGRGDVLKRMECIGHID